VVKGGQREDASASFDFHIPILFGDVLVDTLEWFNVMSFLFYNLFPSSQVYAPPPFV
jgi:hypothetical protein